MKKLEYKNAKVKENIRICDNIYKIVLEGQFSAKGGQFYMLRAWEREPLLSRPISVNDVNESSITFLYAVVGEGTELLSKVNVGEEINVTGPLGNSFSTETLKGKKIALVGGGIGTAPLLLVAKELQKNVDFYGGFRKNPYGLEELKKYTNNIYIATEDGSVGHKGYITELLKPEEYDVVLCCGPEIMMKVVRDMCVQKNIPVYISMEKHMACGVGACLVCTCKTTEGNKRTCKDGPVFDGKNVEF